MNIAFHIYYFLLPILMRQGIGDGIGLRSVLVDYIRGHIFLVNIVYRFHMFYKYSVNTS